jgi:uncharacterized protein (TIGR00730 family)
MTKKRICVFCGSSFGARNNYATAAKILARRFAVDNITLVYGGSNAGLMGILADETLAAGGEVIGIIPRSLVDKEIAHRGLTELKIVDSMHQRKALMSELSDAFIAMPGGYGTFEEFCEVLTWTQLGLQSKPCGLLNVAGFYDPLLQLFDHAVAEQFLKPVHRALVLSDADPESLLDRLFTTPVPVVSKWIDRAQT